MSDDYNHDYAREYFQKIESGEIVSCKRIYAVYKRIFDEIADEKYIYDIDKGSKPIEFVERFCKHSKGEWARKPIKLELFQKAAFQLMHGVLMQNGLRRFWETLWLMGRKNGKSTISAGLGNYHLMADGEGGAEVYSVATKKDQAKIVFNEATNMVKQSPALSKRIKKRKTDLYYAQAFSKFEPLSSDSNTLDGLNVSFCVMDELHAMKTRDLYDVIVQAMSARRQPMLLMVTTSGTIRESIYDEMYEYACNVADQVITDEHFLPLIYELDQQEEWTDPTCWIKANPALGAVKDAEMLANNVAKAKNNPRFLPTVLCKDFNIKATGSTAWLAFDQLNCERKFSMEDVHDTYAVGGCDLSSTIDLTCATLLIRKPNDETIYVLQKYFLPQARIDEIETYGHKEAPYRIWEEQGYLHVCQGEQVDYNDVSQWFVDMVEKYQINPIIIGYDRALAGYWVQQMSDYGFNMERVAQGAYTFSQPMKEMGAALKDKKVNYNNNPMLKWCLANTATKSQNRDSIESIMPIKRARSLRIDGVVSLLNAWVVYNKHYDEFLNIVNYHGENE